jgi:hypothetical protein
MKNKSNKSEESYRKYFYSHVDIGDVSDCWLWTAAKNNIGFGLFRYHGKMQLSHRVQMQLEGHNVDDKYVIHTCRNYLCVNPKHLLVGDMQDKKRLLVEKGSQKVPRKKVAKKTCVHCGTTAFNHIIARVHNDKCKQKP